MNTSAMPELRVTVFSDYICPFCYIGFSRLERLRDEFDLKVNWCLVEIHPETPVEGRPVAELGYPPEQWNRMMAELGTMAGDEGLAMRPHTRTANSRKALLLAEAAKTEGAGIFYRLHRRLFERCFSEGENIGDERVLRVLAGEAGVSPECVERAWQDPRYPVRLQHYLRAARELGVTGTPAFFFDTRMLVGALPTERLRQAARESLAGAVA